MNTNTTLEIIEPIIPKPGDPLFVDPADNARVKRLKRNDFGRFIGIYNMTESWVRRFRNDESERGFESHLHITDLDWLAREFGCGTFEAYSSLQRMEQCGYLTLIFYQTPPDPPCILRIVITHPGYTESVRRLREHYPLDEEAPRIEIPESEEDYTDGEDYTHRFVIDQMPHPDDMQTAVPFTITSDDPLFVEPSENGIQSQIKRADLDGYFKLLYTLEYGRRLAPSMSAALGLAALNIDDTIYVPLESEAECWGCDIDDVMQLLERLAANGYIEVLGRDGTFWEVRITHPGYAAWKEEFRRRYPIVVANPSDPDLVRAVCRIRRWHGFPQDPTIN